MHHYQHSTCATRCATHRFWNRDVRHEHSARLYRFFRTRDRKNTRFRTCITRALCVRVRVEYLIAWDVCLWEWERRRARARARARERKTANLWANWSDPVWGRVWVCDLLRCVCVRETERKGEREMQRKKEHDKKRIHGKITRALYEDGSWVVVEMCFFFFGVSYR